MNEELSAIEKIKLFNKIAGTKDTYDIRKICLYLSLLTEEYLEVIEAVTTNAGQFKDLKVTLEAYRTLFKNGTFDELVDLTLTSKEKRVELLDGICDVIVVSTGLGIALGSDIDGALHQVCNNNLEKFPIVDGEYTVLRDEHGKIKKPTGFTSVELDDFVN